MSRNGFLPDARVSRRRREGRGKERGEAGISN